MRKLTVLLAVLFVACGGKSGTLAERTHHAGDVIERTINASFPATTTPTTWCDATACYEPNLFDRNASFVNVDSDTPGVVSVSTVGADEEALTEAGKASKLWSAADAARMYTDGADHGVTWTLNGNMLVIVAEVR